MERVFIVGLGLAGQLTAASIVVAAKGLLRWPELQSQAGAGEDPPADGVLPRGQLRQLAGCPGCAGAPRAEVFGSGRGVAGRPGPTTAPRARRSLAERVLAAVAHRGASDAEVERGESDGGVEVPRGGLGVAVAVQPWAEPALGPGAAGYPRRRAASSWASRTAPSRAQRRSASWCRAASTSVNSLNWSSPGAIVGGFATRPSSSSQMFEGTLTTPKTSESRCSGSSTGGSPAFPVQCRTRSSSSSRATATRSRPSGSSSPASASRRAARSGSRTRSTTRRPRSVGRGGSRRRSAVGVGQPQLGSEVAAPDRRTTRFAEHRDGEVAVHLDGERAAELAASSVSVRVSRAGWPADVAAAQAVVLDLHPVASRRPRSSHPSVEDAPVT